MNVNTDTEIPEKKLYEPADDDEIYALSQRLMERNKAVYEELAK